MRHKIYGDLTSWNSSIWQFEQLMKDVGANEEITLEVNSYGGDVFIGIDLCNTLRAHPGKVTAIITGIAASAASILVMGADTIKAYSNTQMMIHNAWTIVAGNANELRKVASDLDSIGESVLASYTGRIDADTAKRLLDEETFLSAQKAMELGLIDEVIDAEQAEEVQSEIFRDNAEQFNSLLKNRASSPMDELETQLKELISVLNDAIEKPVKPKEDPPLPKTASLKNIFLNLK